MVRAWVRDELQKKHDLHKDLLLRYIGEKVLSQSDMNPWHARFLLPARAHAYYRTFLYAAENLPGCVLVRLRDQRPSYWPV